jgi:hypothetical protein
MNLDKLHFNRCLASAIVLTFVALPLLAAESEGSLDNMWKDQPPQANSSEKASNGRIDPPAAINRDLQPYQAKAAEADANSTNPTPLDRGQNTALTTPSEAGPANSSEAVPSAENKGKELPAAACQLESFLHSNIVLGTSWPSVGPFKTTTPGPYSLVDSAHNRIGLAVQDNKVMAAELDLLGGSNQIENFANLEMGADFLMEALGSKPKKINEINAQLEANTAVVNGSFTGPIGLVCDPYVIILNKGDSPLSCKLRASNKYMQGAETAQISMADVNDVAVPTTLDAPPHKAPSASTRRPPTTAAVPTPDTSAPTATPPSDKYERLLDSVTKESGSTAPGSSGPRGLAGARTEGRKQEFLELIQSWQRLKKTAVKQRTTAHLSEVLAGAALTRQSGALKTLAEGHKYFDMTPKSVQVDRVEEMVPDKKYYVYAQIKENSKYVDESSGQIIKETDDTYKVRYVVEQAGDHWVISDSALIKPSGTTPPQGSKPH